VVKRLVISPHIDDEVLGCGGQLDRDTFVVECGVDDFHIVSRVERIQELDKVKQKTGIDYVILENKVNSYEVSPLIEEITTQINRLKPEEVCIPYPSYNQDHQTVYKACMVALRPHDINHFVKRVLVYEETQVIAWDYANSINDSFKPNLFRRINIEDKLDLYLLMKSQVRAFRSPDFLRELAKIRGRQSMLDYAEAFQCIRWVE